MVKQNPVVSSGKVPCLLRRWGGGKGLEQVWGEGVLLMNGPTALLSRICPEQIRILKISSAESIIPQKRTNPLSFSSRKSLRGTALGSTGHYVGLLGNPRLPLANGKYKNPKTLVVHCINKD